jgi:DNA-binding IclR family transcriptional regulator
MRVLVEYARSGHWGWAAELMKKKEAQTRGKSKRASEPRRYRAPALEKGLDILELVSRSPVPLTAAMITQTLGRSTGELFRMIQVLEYRGFIAESPSGTGYVPTTRLFSMGMEQAPTKNLLESSLPIMRRLSTQTDQSCHVAVRAGGDIVVVARMESAGQIGFTVRIGHRRPMYLSSSGVVLYAFQSPEVRESWGATFDPKPTAAQMRAFLEQVEKVRKHGYEKLPSSVVQGVTDLSAPVFRGDHAAASLTMTFVHKTPMIVSQAKCLELLRESAKQISAELPSFDHRL